MAHYGTLRDFHFTDIDETTDDIRGAKVYGLNDEKLGKIAKRKRTNEIRQEKKPGK